MKLIIANWKCNPATRQEAERLLNTIKKSKFKKEKVVFCPPFVWLSLFSDCLSGAQDCHWENKGTFTGAISPLMLKDLGVKYVILGHSERREYFGETDEMVNMKIKAVLKNGLKPVLCVGEKERETTDSEGRTVNDMGLVVGEQLEKALDGISKSRVKDIVITYEPVWAISTGVIGSVEPCLPDDAVRASLFIRKTLVKMYGRGADKVKVLYGGSVNSKNVADYIKEDRIDGVLVGGASLNASDFIKIIEKVHENSA